MNFYTVSLFGHRILDSPKEAEERLFAFLRELFSAPEYGCLEFLVGRNGDFDLLAASVVKRLIRAFGGERATLVLVLPYPTAEWRKNESELLNYYDEVEIFEESAKRFYKDAIGARNRKMIDRSNLVVCWLRNEHGGTFQAIRYAKMQGRKIRNLAGESGA
ncbi:MAG: hypothetical protein E7680_04785 [Ruminococcaceae bacterium]|nr:hypothetical protein [Oscillospiraceae bacterium]